MYRGNFKNGLLHGKWKFVDFGYESSMDITIVFDEGQCKSFTAEHSAEGEIERHSKSNYPSDCSRSYIWSGLKPI